MNTARGRARAAWRLALKGMTKEMTTIEAMTNCIGYAQSPSIATLPMTRIANGMPPRAIRSRADSLSQEVFIN